MARVYCHWVDNFTWECVNACFKLPCLHTLSTWYFWIIFKFITAMFSHNHCLCNVSGPSSQSASDHVWPLSVSDHNWAASPTICSLPQPAAVPTELPGLCHRQLSAFRCCGVRYYITEIRWLWIMQDSCPQSISCNTSLDKSLIRWWLRSKSNIYISNIIGQINWAFTVWFAWSCKIIFVLISTQIQFNLIDILNSLVSNKTMKIPEKRPMDIVSPELTIQFYWGHLKKTS